MSIKVETTFKENLTISQASTAMLKSADELKLFSYAKKSRRIKAVFSKCTYFACMDQGCKDEFILGLRVRLF